MASKLLIDTEAKWFSELAASYGLLLCADRLVPFYQRLGWQRVASEVHCEKHQRDCVWAEECMVLSPKREAIDPAIIDLWSPVVIALSDGQIEKFQPLVRAAPRRCMINFAVNCKRKSA